MKIAELDAVQACDAHMQATITLRRVRELRFRCWLAKRLVLLAAWIMPGVCKIFEEGKEEQP